jgi:transcriptional regulator with XRE-family HTH domain
MGKQLRSSRHKALIEALADTRKRAGLTQRELAVKLDRAHSFIGKIESGERQLDVLEFCELAEALDADPIDLLKRILRT